MSTDELHPTNSCGIADCPVHHGWYPQMEHELMAADEATFDKFCKTMRRYFGLELTRSELGLFVQHGKVQP